MPWCFLRDTFCCFFSVLLSLIHFITLKINLPSKSLPWLDYRLRNGTLMMLRNLSESTPLDTAYKLLMAYNQSPDFLVWIKHSSFFCFQDLTLYLMFPSSDSNLKNLAGTLILMNVVFATPTACKAYL